MAQMAGNRVEEEARKRKKRGRGREGEEKGSEFEEMEAGLQDKSRLCSRVFTGIIALVAARVQVNHERLWSKRREQEGKRERRKTEQSRKKEEERRRGRET